MNNGCFPFKIILYVALATFGGSYGWGFIIFLVLRDILTGQSLIQERGNAFSGNGGWRNPAEAWNQHRTSARQEDFLELFVSAVAKMAKADGRITTNEIHVVEQLFRVLQLTPERAIQAKDIFNVAKDSPESFESIIKHFRATFSQLSLRQLLLSALVNVAASDQTISRTEHFLLRQACVLLGLYPGLLDKLIAEFTGGGYREESYQSQSRNRAPLADDYALLGVSLGATKEQLKKAYRKKAMEFHPDRVQAKGLPPEMVKIASDQLARINAAYDAIMKHLG